MSAYCFDIVLPEPTPVSDGLYPYLNCAISKRVFDGLGGSVGCASDWQPGPSCSKLTTSLVNNSLKFTSSDTQIR